MRYKREQSKTEKKLWSALLCRKKCDMHREKRQKRKYA